MIYFTSDLHFWHKNAIEYTSRPFATVEEMNEKLIEYWNKTIHPNDEVYILGDVTMVRPGRAMEIIAQLKGRKYLLMGNHDYFAREKTVLLGGLRHRVGEDVPRAALAGTDFRVVPLSVSELEQGLSWIL